MPANASIRKQVTEQIIQAIQLGLKPWRRPWSTSPNSGRATNVISRRPYTGINPLLIELHRLEHGLSSRWYGTFHQWERLHCHVMKRPEHVEPGKWGAKIIFYKPITRTHTDPDTGKETEDQFFLLRQWTVFSADQVEGAEPFRVNEDEPDHAAVPDFAPAEELITRSGANIRHQGDRAFYKPPVPYEDWPWHKDGDYIVLPSKSRFNSIGSYYKTVLHELAHWSEVRFGWTGSYAMGELVAEIAASFVSTGLNVPQSAELENHASYLSSWLEAMKGDPSYIFKASTQASKVADYLLAFVQEKAAAGRGLANGRDFGRLLCRAAGFMGSFCGRGA